MKLTRGKLAVVAAVSAYIVLSGATPRAQVPVFVDGERPPVNLTTGVITLAGAPSPAGSLQLFVNGIVQTAGRDYTISGVAVTPMAVDPTQPEVDKPGEFRTAREITAWYRR